MTFLFYEVGREKFIKTFEISGKTTYQLSFRNWKRSDIKIFAENRKNVIFGYIADRKIKNFYEKGEKYLFCLHRGQKEKFLKKIRSNPNLLTKG